MKRMMVLASTLALGLTACGGSGGSSGDASAKRGPTGYLKFSLPELPITAASVSSVEPTVGAQAWVTDAGSYADAPSILYWSTINENTPTMCKGGASNIPFVICIIESLGINAPGTYTGLAPNNQMAKAVVSELSGDPDGYTLQAEVTMMASGEKAFKYKGNADGKKGMIEIKSHKLFSGPSVPDNEGLRMAWDTTISSAQTIEYTYHYAGSDSTVTANSTDYAVAVLDAGTGIADIAMRRYHYVNSNSGFVEANSRFTQARIGAARAIMFLSECTNGSSPTEGNECFAVSTGSVHELVTGKPLVCGTVNMSGVPQLDVGDSLALSNSTPGSYATSASFADAQCESLRTGLNNGNAFSIRLDKNASAAASLNGIHHIMRAKTYAELKLMSNAGFLN